MIAHVGAMPVEELLLPVAAWGGAGLLLARGWIASLVRRRRRRVWRPADEAATAIDADRGLSDRALT
jgi:hypothetical protein